MVTKCIAIWLNNSFKSSSLSFPKSLVSNDSQLLGKISIKKPQQNEDFSQY